MGPSLPFAFQPTFTQGLVVGQLSILVLFFFVFKYLFLTKEPLDQSASYRPRASRNVSSTEREKRSVELLSESAEWLNATLLHIIDAYRSKLRDDLSESDGEDLMRQRVQDFANTMRPKEMLAPITIHAIDLGMSAPRLSNARSNPSRNEHSGVQFDLSYTDTISVSLSTSYLFNYPVFAFAQLPVSLTISLSLFACSVVITPPAPTSPAPALTISIPPDFTLELKTSSLLGSRAKLADVPKLHELITDQIRRQLIRRGSIKIPLPGLASVAEVKQEVKREMLGSELDR